ncbi:MAG: hypothetical protein Q9180_005269 [Flavoplaca navasiana]
MLGFQIVVAVKENSYKDAGIFNIARGQRNLFQEQEPVLRIPFHPCEDKLVMLSKISKISFVLLLASTASCDPAGHPWQHPLPTDRKVDQSHTLSSDKQLTISLGRSPCPGINAVANHGYIPRNGMNISLEQFITGFREGLNFDAGFVTAAVDVYQNFTTAGYNNTLNLNDLEHHAGKLIPPHFSIRPRVPGEHDGSLSRNDLFFGDNHSFNEKIWNITAAHFRKDTLSLATAGRARKDRYAAAEALNPDFTPSIVSSLGETALYLKAMQGQDNQTKTEYVQILFRELALPSRGFPIPS